MKRCPLCQSDQVIPFFQKNGCDVLYCGHCSFGFVDVRMDSQALRQLYDSDYFFGNSAKFGYHDYLSEKANRVSLFRDKAEYLQARYPQGGRLLDVGCADGSFLELFPSTWVAEGVELSASMCEKIAPPIRKRVFQGFFEDFQANEPYDVVTMWDVLDHVTDPAAVLRKAYQLVKPGGHIGIVTGDLRSLCARLMGKFWYLYIPPVHLSYFSRKSIDRALRTAGFDAVHIRYEGKRVSLPLVFYRVGHLISNKPWQSFFQTISDHMPGVSFNLNLFDVMAIWATRR